MILRLSFLLCGITLLSSAMFILFGGFGHLHASDPPPEPPDYRMSNFRAPVPTTLKGARIVDTREAEILWRAKETIFIDVLPRPPKPKNLPKDTIWRDKRRDNIPGSVWLVNVGFGKLHPTVDTYFRKHLSRLTNENTKKPILFYCLEKCWMSWNAAKRALEYGYSNVTWYPDGTDGWKRAGLPLEEKQPLR